MLLPKGARGRIKEIIEQTKEQSQPYEMVNNPKHYNNYSIEVIDMMEGIWGKEQTALWCEMTAYKYRMRVGTKPDNSIEQDLAKEKWYLDKAKELREKLKHNESTMYPYRGYCLAGHRLPRAETYCGR